MSSRPVTPNQPVRLMEPGAPARPNINAYSVSLPYYTEDLHNIILECMGRDSRIRYCSFHVPQQKIFFQTLMDYTEMYNWVDSMNSFIAGRLTNTVLTLE